MTAESSKVQPLRSDDPRQLGRYTMVGRLGEGGMGTVYLARTPLQTLVAVKVIRADLVDAAEFRRRFRSEVERARQVPPFCTAEVFDADPDHEQPYLVVEFVDGPSLAAVVGERGALTPANLHGLAIGVATALTAIHGAGVIHRDLKPNNVLLAPGSPKVIDFGIARAVDGAVGQTRTDQLVGTVAYMAPERFEPQDRTIVTEAADIFAWGAVIAFAGTGRSPFPGDSPPVVAVSIMTRPPDLVGLAEPLRGLVERALAKNPVDRPTARELLDELLAAVPRRSPELAAALARQPGLLAAAGDARAADKGVPTVSGSSEGAEREPLGSNATTRFGSATPPVVAAPGSPADDGRSGRWRWVPAVAAFTALLMSLTAVWLVFNGRGLPVTGHGGQSTPTVTAASSTSPSASRSEPPSASGPPTVRDSLASANLWQPRDDPANRAKCTLNGALVVAKYDSGPYRCPGVVDTFRNFTATVDVTLATGASCAGIWFRFKTQGYALRVCRGAYHLVAHGADGPTAVTPLTTIALDRPLRPKTPVRVGITVRGTSFELERDGRRIGSWRDSRYREGRTVLGIFPDKVNRSERTPSQVSFANIVVRPLPD